MNILIPHKWLLEHLKTQATPEKIQELLSLCGPSVERIVKSHNQPVYDIEVTTNRVDSMSIRGIAREAAAILPEFNIPAKLKALKLPSLQSSKDLDFTIKNDPQLCKRILAIKLENIEIGPSPKWMQTRLKQVNQRPLNNVIDITNYIMWEIGHPVHVFDYDKLNKKTIIVRQAKKGETLITLDDKKHTLEGGEVVFDDSTGKIIDLPGIMGTKNSVVDNNSKNILLWIESIDAVKIRQASMALAIRSQAAVLNEKHVDTHLGLTTILRGIDLFSKVTNANLGSRLVDIFPQKLTTKKITLAQEKLDAYLGLKVSPLRVKRILENLGCKVIFSKDSNNYQVTPPSFRAKDLTISQDLIEEIARIYGYHNLPSVIMDTQIPDNPPDDDFRFEFNLKRWLAGWGLSEIYTYSMVSKDLALQSAYSLKQHLKIQNPISDDRVFMRRSLIPSLLEAIGDNQRKQISIFEMQNVYHPAKTKANLPHEELQLAITTTKEFIKLKGILDAIAEKLFIENLRVEPIKYDKQSFNPSTTGNILANGKNLGIIGKISNTNISALFIRMESLRQVSRPHPKYIPLITTPPIVEDLTFSIKQGVYIGHLIEEIKLTSKLIEKVELKYQFRPKKSSCHQNYTFTITFRHHKRSLSDKELVPVRKKIAKNLKKSFATKLIGKLQ